MTLNKSEQNCVSLEVP